MVSQNQVLDLPVDSGLTPPRQYGVFLLNDDYTPVDFVVEVLMQVFGFTERYAQVVALITDCEGRCLCGEYVYDVALTKKHQLDSRARDAGFPLSCVLEEVL